jgi:hypothetical protein
VYFAPEVGVDIFVFGFQELDLSKENFLFNNSTMEQEWSRQIEAGFHQGHSYVQIISKRLVGVLLMIYATAEVGAHIRNLSYDTQGTGIFGSMGNKGAVSVRFDLHSTSCCFVVSHLAAHDDGVLRRNHDFHEILRRTRLEMPPPEPERCIADHDYIFWAGDLNYRITSISDAAVKDLLRLGKFEVLLQQDQLAEERAAGNVFNGFSEAQIAFPPTYKYIAGTDSLENKKDQTPAWCDRVLYKCNAADDSLAPLVYGALSFFFFFGMCVAVCGVFARACLERWAASVLAAPVDLILSRSLWPRYAPTSHTGKRRSPLLHPTDSASCARAPCSQLRKHP